MVETNTSNLSRTEYRKKYRQKMSEHICKGFPPCLLHDRLTYRGTKLGITVKPKDVRSITTAQDSYAWQVLLGKEHLFKRDILKKHISKHSIGAYRHLYRAIGDSLETVLPPDLGGVEWEASDERVARVRVPFDTRACLIKMSRTVRVPRSTST